MSKISSILRDKAGVTLPEFALIVPVLFMTLLGIFDMGHRAYLNSVLYGAVQKAGRDSSLETGAAQQVAIKTKIIDQINPVLLGSTITVTRMANKSFQSVSSGEPFTDADSDGIRDSGECFDDEDGDGTWDSTIGNSGGGGANDVVTYKATINYAHIFPFPSLVGGSNNDTLVATTVLRNQPYSDDTTIARVCS